MNTQTKKAVLASAISVALASFIAAPAFAGNHSHKPDNSKTVSKHDQINYSANIRTDAKFHPDAYAQAMITDNQNISENIVVNNASSNTSSVKGNAFRDATGNLQANVAAGDNNAQDNSAAIAALDAGFVFGAAQSVTDVHQNSQGNGAFNSGARNNASISGNAFQGAAGNMGLNVASGNFNGQKNNAAISVGGLGNAIATVQVDQTISGNKTVNDRQDVGVDTGTLTASMNMSGVSGTYNGTSDQVGDVYLDIWKGEKHPGGDNIGHVDVDHEAQGAKDPAGDGGAFLFKEKGNLSLAGTAAATFGYTSTVWQNTQNNASLSGNAFQGATGNVGANIASGTNNMQSNNLSISAITTSFSGGGE